MKRFFLLLLTSILVLPSIAQVDTEFWCCIPPRSTHGIEGAIQLVFFSYDESANVTIEFPASPGIPTERFTMSASSSHIQILSKDSLEATQWMAPRNEIGNRGIHITSDAPISCYLQFTSGDGEAYSLKGAKALGTQFYVGMQNQQPNCGFLYDDFVPFNSVDITATEDNTLVTIYPSRDIDVNQYFNVSERCVQVTLNKGQIYSCVASGLAGNDHLTGTRVVANKPIVVSSTDSSVRPDYPINTHKLWCTDLAGDQIVSYGPNDTEFIVVTSCMDTIPFEGVSITTTEDDTKITCGDMPPFTISKKGTSRWISMEDFSRVCYIRSNKPIVVYQLTGLHYEIGGTQLPRLECTGSQEINYLRLGGSIQTFLHIITKAENINDFTINGKPVDHELFEHVSQTEDWMYANIDYVNEMELTQRLINVKCKNGIFQMGVLDRDEPSVTYGYFTDYDVQAETMVTYTDSRVSDKHVADVINAGYADHLTLAAGMKGYHNEYIWYNAKGEKIWEGATLTFNRLTFADAGTYTVKGKNTSICGGEPKTFTINVVDNATPVYVSLCTGSTYPFHNQTLSSSGTYRITDNNVSYLVHVDEVENNLWVMNDTSIVEGSSLSLRAGGCDSISWKNEKAEYCETNLIFDKPGTYKFTCTGIVFPKTKYDGTIPLNKDEQKASEYFCSHRQAVTIKVLPYRTIHLPEANVCNPDFPFDWNGQHISDIGEYRDTCVSSTGCRDSITVLNVRKIFPSDSLFEYVICANEHVDWLGERYNTSQDIQKVIPNHVGCDSVCSLKLIVLPLIEEHVSAFICWEDTFRWNGREYLQSTEDFITVPSLVTGCDSTTWLHLTKDSCNKLDSPCLDLVYTKWNDVLFCANADNRWQTYQWYKDDQILPGETKQYLSQGAYSSSSSYRVRATDTKGITRFSCPQQFRQTALEQVEMPQLVWTTDNQLIVKYGATGAIIRIFAPDGQLQYQQTWQQEPLDLPLPKGIYIVQYLEQICLTTTLLID